MIRPRREGPPRGPGWRAPRSTSPRRRGVRPPRLGPAWAGLLAFSLAACSPIGAGRPPLPPPPHPAFQGPALAAIRRAGVLRVASDLSYPPLAFREHGVPAGFEVELAGLLAAALGVRLEIVDTPRAAMSPGFRDVDLLLSEWTPDQAPGPVSASYFAMRQGILWREGQDASGGSLRGVRVAVQVQSAGQAVVEQSGGIPALVAYTPAAVLDAVWQGAAEAAVADLPLVTEYARTHPHLRASAVSGPVSPLVAVVRAGAPDLLAFASAAIHELERQHGLDQLRRRWRL